MPRTLRNPPGKFGDLARLSRAPERSGGAYVSTGAQRKRSQNPKSPGVVEAQDTGDGSGAQFETFTLSSIFKNGSRAALTVFEGPVSLKK